MPQGNGASAVGPPDTASGATLTWVRRIAVGAWVAGLAMYCVLVGVPTDRTSLLVWTAAGVVAASIGRRRVRLVFVDFLPLAIVLIGYSYLRGIASSLGTPTEWHFQLDIDKALFGGHVPTVWLQEHLRYHAVQWWEALVAICYLSYFVLVVATSGVLWLRSRRDFYRWSYRFAPLCLLCFIIFAVMPTAPPWAAARCTSVQVADHPADPACIHQNPSAAKGGLLGPLPRSHDGVRPYVQRLSGRGLKALQLKRAGTLLGEKQAGADVVAAFPSLHSAGVLLFVIFMWRRVRRRWRPLLALYPLAMTFTLVYTGEHYVSDVLVGWLFAVLVSVAAWRVEGRLFQRRDEAPAVEREPALVA